MNVAIIILPIAAFVFGSIPFGLVISQIFHRTDIRSQGSGNIGAMNALRTLGKTSAIVVLLLDALKGFVPTFLATYSFAGYFGDSSTHARYIALIAALAIIGHCFSPWLGFKGGKGVATGFGAILGIAWPVGVIGFLAWLTSAVLTRYSSLSSMLASIAAAIALHFFMHETWLTIWGVFMVILVMYTHRENIARLRSGTENRIRLSNQS